VLALQKFLNSNLSTRIAISGPGSPGNEQPFFGPATAQAIARLQNEYASEVLAPAGLNPSTGFVVPLLGQNLILSFCRVKTLRERVAVRAALLQAEAGVPRLVRAVLVLVAVAQEEMAEVPALQVLEIQAAAVPRRKLFGWRLIEHWWRKYWRFWLLGWKHTGSQ